MKPLLSVVIPVYNGSEYIESLMSLLKENQHPEVEFVVVDDGSKDNSGKLIEQFSEGIANFSLISKENGGVSTARNSGIENARGDYIWFVDADDIIETGTTEKICKSLETGHDFYVYDSKYEIGEKIHDLESFKGVSAFEKNDGASALMMENLMTETHTNAVWNKVFKREIIMHNNVRFPEGVINGEDTCFLLDYCDKIKDIKYVKESIYLYIIRQGSAANNIRPETVKGFVPVYEKKIGYCQKYGLAEVENHIRKGFVNKMLRAFFHMKRNVKVNNNSLKDCISRVVADEYIRGEFEKLGNVFSGTIKKYYKMHMNKNVNGIYRMVTLMAFVYGIKRLLKK